MSTAVNSHSDHRAHGHKAAPRAGHRLGPLGFLEIDVGKVGPHEIALSHDRALARSPRMTNPEKSLLSLRAPVARAERRMRLGRALASFATTLAVALGAAIVWGAYSVLSRRLPPAPAVVTAAACLPAGLLALLLASPPALPPCPPPLVPSGALLALPAWRWLDIQAGFPLVTAATREDFVPQMADFEKLGGVSFHKGCYPGQEVVARTQYLGKVKRHLYRVTSDQALVAGIDLHSPDNPDQACGKIVSGAPSPAGGYEALAVVQSNFAGNLHLGSREGPQIEAVAVNP